MSKKLKEPEVLRAEAEAQIARTQMTMKMQPYPNGELLHELTHELRVYQIELEMQNEELRRAHAAMEESRDRYVDLYEFAPVGYLTLTREGMIDKINLTGATLLGVERKKLLNRRFASFISPEDSSRWYAHLAKTLEHRTVQSCELVLKRRDDSRFHAQLDCLHMKDGEVSSVRIALSDITERKRVE